MFQLFQVNLGKLLEDAFHALLVAWALHSEREG